MKTIAKQFVLALAIATAFIVTTCKQTELGDTGFPRVRTLFVEMISDTGAYFKGEILDIPADCEVIDYGFVWSDYAQATNYLEKHSLGRTNKTGAFQVAINRAMVEGKKYFFKAYIQTPTLTIYGNEMEFVSLGSHAPVITSISPASGSWYDTITIHGRYFSDNKYQMLIYFNDKLGDNIKSSETEIRTCVPIALDSSVSKLSMRFANVIYTSNQVFTLVPNISVSSIEPASGSWNTVVKIKGKNLKYAQGIFFNNILTTIKSLSDSVVETIVPYNLNSQVSDVAIKINSFQFKAPQKFTFIPGNIKSITPETGTTGTQVTIKTNNIRTINAKVSINGIEAPVKTKTDSTITVTMPQLSKSGNFPIVISDGSFTITYENAFEYKIPEITGVSEAIWGSTITIKGKNFDLFNTWSIYYGTSNYKSYKATITSFSSNEIKISFEADHYKEYNKIYLEASNFVYPLLLDVKIMNPIIEEVIGPKDYMNPINIIGKYFNPIYTEISLMETGQLFTPFQKSNTGFTFNMIGAFRGSYSIKFQTRGYNDPVILNNCIQWDVPIKLFKEFKDNNFSLNSIIIFPGINDQNFYIKRFTETPEEYYYEHNTASLNLVTNSFPTTYSSGTFSEDNKLFICTGSISSSNYIYSKSVYEYNLISKTYTNLSDFPGQARAGTAAFSFNGKGYLVGGYTYNNKSYSYTPFNEIWQFDINSQIWTLINTINIDPREDIKKFKVGNYFYIFNKFNIWKFDPTNNSLENIFNSPAFPGQYLTPHPFFCQNNKIYFHFGSDAQCWEFDLILKKWTFLFHFPFKYKYIEHSYIINNKAYLLIKTFGDYYTAHFSIIEFDPAYLK